MPDRLDGFAVGRDLVIDAATAAGISADGAGERFVEPPVTADEPFDIGRPVEKAWDQDEAPVSERSPDTMWC